MTAALATPPARARVGAAGKYLLWLREALRRYPRVRFVALGDDDVYISLGHLAADLRLVLAQQHARAPPPQPLPPRAPTHGAPLTTADPLTVYGSLLTWRMA